MFASLDKKNSFLLALDVTPFASPLCAPQSFKGVVIERQSPLNVTGSDCQKKRGTALQNSTSTYTKSEFPYVFMMNNGLVTIFFGAQFATKYISVALYMYFDSLLLYLQT